MSRSSSLFAAMEARPVNEIPQGPEWQYEPKWEGFSSAIKAKDKLGLTDKLEEISDKRSFTGKAPGGVGRWSTKRSSEWTPVKPKYVAGVSYDHITGGRFRHGTSILRWRSDKRPDQSTMDVKQKRARRLTRDILVQ